jgi:di/tricarboxylate transporter
VTRDQVIIFGILAAMMTLFLWDRLRYDIVALLALLAAVLTGIIPADKAFSGFSNQVIPLIAGALVVSAAVGRSGLIESCLRRAEPLMRTTSSQVAVLTTAVALLAGFMKNVGALAIFMPVAIQVAQLGRRSASQLLMPLGFAALIGGSMTLIGTSPNILISGLRQELLGAPFEMFDFFPAAAATVVAGLVFLAFGWRLIPRRQPRTPPESLFRVEDYTTEARIPAGASVVGKTVAELEALAENRAAVVAIIRERFRRYVPAGNWTLYEGDVLVLESGPHALEQVVAAAGLELVGSEPLGEKPEDKPQDAESVGSVEAVVTPDSQMIGASTAALQLRERFGVNLLAVSRRGHRTSARLRRVRFRAGDVVVLQGHLAAMPEKLAELGCLPLAARDVQLGRPRKAVLPIAILAAAILAASVEIVPPAVAFVAAAVAVALGRLLTLKEIYTTIEWPILVLLGALIPVGEAVQHTGAAELVASALSTAAGSLPALAVLALVMATTMIVTPFLHHAAAVIVMGPIAASLADRLGLHVDPFLIAVAIGANSDFLSPIGHQCNTLVMGPGGYRFGDYWHLGLPLSLIVLAVGAPMIAVFWPLR